MNGSQGWQKVARVMLYGIDLSGNNGDVNFDGVAMGGSVFFFQKATEGARITDGTFGKNVRAGRDRGLLSGAYHFLHVNESLLPQLNHFLAVAGGGQVEFPLAVDFERLDGDTPTFAVDTALSFCAMLSDAIGQPAILYLPARFLPSYPPAAATYLLWVAEVRQLAADGSIQDPHVPPPFKRWTFHQYRGDAAPQWNIEAGKSMGVETACDLNRFDGDWDDLATLAGHDPLDVPTRPERSLP
jgi:lysozyme